MRSHTLAALALIGLATRPALASDVQFTQDAVLLPAPLDAYDATGYAIDVDGDTLALSAHGYGPYTEFSGAVFIFGRQGDGWVQEAVLVGSHVSNGDGFGFDLDLEGDRLVIGAGGAESGAMNSGEAYVFERAEGVWHQRARLVPGAPEANALFGADVALRGDRIVIGAPNASSLSGSVSVFEPVAGAWAEVQVLHPSAPGDDQLFGTSVDLDGDTLVIGAPWADLDTATTTMRYGAVYVFEHDGNAFVEEAALAAEFDPSYPQMSQWLGQAVAIEGDTIVAGAPRSGSGRGNAFVFERAGGAWTQRAQLASAIFGTGWAGDAVAIEGDRIALGCPLYPAPYEGEGVGAVTLWERQSEGWVERALLVVDSVRDGGALGSGVAFDGDRVLAGDPASNLADYRAGALFLFTAPAATGESFCFGDGLGTACPCSWNNSTPGAAGCRNSSTGAGVLMGLGTPSVLADDLLLAACGLLPNQPALLFHGTDELDGGDGVVFGNGLRCVGGTTARVTVRVPDAQGGASWDALASSEGFAPGQIARFQVWYRDPAASCGHGFNLSNALRVTFEP